MTVVSGGDRTDEIREQIAQTIADAQNVPFPGAKQRKIADAVLASAPIESLRAQVEAAEASETRMIEDRDHWQDRMTELIYQLASVEEVGEWSSTNDPGVNVVEVVQGREFELRKRAEAAEAEAERLGVKVADRTDALDRAEAERDDAVREMEARELHHFEVENERDAALAKIDGNVHAETDPRPPSEELETMNSQKTALKYHEMRTAVRVMHAEMDRLRHEAEPWPGQAERDAERRDALSDDLKTQWGWTDEDLIWLRSEAFNVWNARRERNQ